SVPPGLNVSCICVFCVISGKQMRDPSTTLRMTSEENVSRTVALDIPCKSVPPWLNGSCICAFCVISGKQMKNLSTVLGMTANENRSSYLELI
ncbi:hypothetical protein, partial [Pedobacter sp. UBA5917]|uniref:hypothetical protein n=1 Tax=Pedobacter sp. UBA5917 TaxID=1947061 RepID=UPI0025FF39BA